MRFSGITTVTWATALLVAVTLSPVAARQSVEELDGTLEVLVEDHPRGAVVHHFLHTGRGRIRLLEAPGESDLKGTATGQRVRARGRRSQDGHSFELKPGGESGVTTLAAATRNALGQQRVLVIMANFQDNKSLSTNYSDAYQTTFSGVNAFYQENSYGQMYLTGDVAGPFTLPMSSSVCDSDQIATLAEQAAVNAGVNVSSYPRRVYAFPNNGCGWWGLASVGGNPSRAWINGSYATKIVAHELGHNLGGWHSHSQPCQNGVCSVSEYGHDRDMMGGPGQGHLNAYQKERLGWLNNDASLLIQTVTASGTYFISTLQSPDVKPKALKVLQTAAAGASTYYYVETRAQVGFDGAYSPGVLIHTGNESNGNSSLQVDLDPFSSNFDAMLDPGQIFTDGVRNITFRTLSVDATGAWVSVAMPAAFTPGASTSSVRSVTPPPPAAGTPPRPLQPPTAASPAASNAPADLALSLKTSMTGGQFTLTATVRNNGEAVKGVSVKISVKNPLGTLRQYVATTNSRGIATLKESLDPMDPRGAYVATATATLSGSTSTSSAGFIY